MDTETDLLPSIQNDGKTSDFFVILSVFSWIILVITCWMPILSLGISDNEIIMFVWLFKKRKENDEYYKEANNILDMNFAVFNVVIITTFILTTLGFLIYVYSLYKKKEKVLNGMLGSYSKFHFIPLLFISALFIIGESYYGEPSEIYSYNYIDVIYFGFHPKEIKYIFSLIFTCLAIFSLIFISLTTKITSPWYVPLTINKGAFSCFFALLIYNFGYVLSHYILYKKDYNVEDSFNFVKKSTLAFVIIIGTLNNTASVLLQDFMIALINLLIYLGMTINFYKKDKDTREYFQLYESIGILDIIMMSLSFLCIVFHIIRFKGIIPD